VIEKVARLRRMIASRDIDIEIDGGVSVETAPLVVRAGANVLVAGSSLFRGGSAAYAGNIAALRRSVACVASRAE
jgi:ribulose-phosphate 3-epimerase